MKNSITSEEFYYATLGCNIIFYDELKKLLLRLKEINISVIVLKGMALAETVYPHIGLRPMADIDLLVRKEDCLSIERELLALGYHPQSVVSPCYIKEKIWGLSITFDLHPGLWYVEDRDLEEVWKRALPHTIDGIESLIMEPSDMLIHISVHSLVDHGILEKTWLTDIVRTIGYYNERIDWGYIIRKAKYYNLQIPLYRAFSHALTSGASIPQSVLDELKPATFIQSLEDKLYQFILKGLLPERTRYFLIRRIRKPRLLLRFMFPQGEFLKIRYGSSAALYWFYIVRLFLIPIKALWTTGEAILKRGKSPQ